MDTQPRSFHDNLPPVQHVELASGPLAYRRAGSGPPLVLLHGWGGSSRHWYQLLGGLASLRTIYALDLPGYGVSPPMAGPLGAERLADYVIAFADALHLGSFELNGHSFGGAVAAYVAAGYPERVRRLIISCFGTTNNPLERVALDQVYLQWSLLLAYWRPWWGIWQPWHRTWQQMLANAGHLPLVPWMVARPFFQAMPDDPELLREGYSEFVLMDQRTSLENTISLGSPRVHQAMRQISVPTLLVGATDDLIVPRPAIESAAALIPNSRIAWIEQCGHVPMVEQPIAYQWAIYRFLVEQSTAQTAAA